MMCCVVMWCVCVVWCCVVLCCDERYCAVLYCAVMLCVASHYIVRYRTVYTSKVSNARTYNTEFWFTVQLRRWADSSALHEFFASILFFVCEHTHTFTHAHTYTLSHTQHTRTYTHTYIHIHTHTHMHTHTHTHAHTTGNVQQHAWHIVNTRLPYKQQVMQIEARVDWVFQVRQ